MPLYLSVAGVQAEGDPVQPAPCRDDVPLPAGRRLVAVVHNGEWQSALDVSHPDAYRRLQQRLQQGVWQGLQLFSLEEQQAVALADGRRATMLGQPVPAPAPAARR